MKTSQAVETLRTFNSVVGEMLGSSFYQKNTRTELPNGKYRYSIGASPEEFVFMITKLRFIDNEKDGIALKVLERIYENDISADASTMEELSDILRNIADIRDTRFRTSAGPAGTAITLREIIQKYTYGHAVHLSQSKDFQRLSATYGDLFQIGLFVGIQNIGVQLSRLKKLNEDSLKRLAANG
jgi:hypothetical protein